MAAALAVCPALVTKCQATRPAVVARTRAADSLLAHANAPRCIATSAAATDSFAGTFEAFSRMDAKQSAFSFGNQAHQDCEERQERESSSSHAACTDSEQASEEEGDRRAKRAQRLRAMSGWGKAGHGFPTPPSDTAQSKLNNVDF